jgi:hypothetical protein
LPLFIFVVLCVFLGDCGGEKPTGDVWRFLTGVVRDSISGTPIDSAWIDINDTIAPFIAFSDTNGFYGMAFGTKRYGFKLYAGKEGYLTRDTSIVLPEGQISIDSVNIYLKAE